MTMTLLNAMANKFIIVLFFIALNSHLHAEDIINQIEKYPYVGSMDSGSKYADLIEYLNKHSHALDSVSPKEMYTLILSFKGAYIKNFIPSDKWSSLQKSEIEILGKIIISLKRRVNPRVDVTRQILESYPPYEMIASKDDLNNEEKKAAYNNSVTAQIIVDHLESEQIRLNRSIKDAIKRINSYLTGEYSRLKVSNAEITATLSGIGVDSETISLLIK